MSDSRKPVALIRFTPFTLLAFSVGLVATGSGATLVGLAATRGRTAHTARPATGARDDLEDEDAPAPPRANQPWGELLVREIEFEWPDEYVAFELGRDPPNWEFPGADRAHVRDVLQRSGVAPEQVERALSSAMLMSSGTGLSLRPDDELLLSMSPAVRSLLYHDLGASQANRYMHNPYRTRPGDMERWFSGPPFGEEILKLVQRLSYAHGTMQYFSDVEAVLAHIPNESTRFAFIKTLSRQHTLLLRLRVRPTTDLAALLGYWSVPGVHVTDIKPLFESLKRLPTGGSVSLTYLLPRFARERLYTFPVLSNTGKSNPTVDCHWATLNFFNQTPDDRFADPAYVVPYVMEHFYKIGAPTRYGDRIFLIDKSGKAIHSAVYIADDIVFTKNGRGVAQPFVLMHLKDVLDMYTFDELSTLTVWRERQQ